MTHTIEKKLENNDTATVYSTELRDRQTMIKINLFNRNKMSKIQVTKTE